MDKTEDNEVTAAVKERKLSYRLHDPNPAAATAGCILNIFIEANAGKVEAAIQNAAAANGKTMAGAADAPHDAAHVHKEAVL